MLRLGVIFLFFFPITASFAQSLDDMLTASTFKMKLEPSIEFLIPTDSDRNIQTLSGNLLFGLEFFEQSPLSIYGGITITHAWGNIRQWENNIKVQHENKAIGVGPVFLLRFEPYVYYGLSVSGDASGGIIVYSTEFPYGGDIYNFMWRIGLSLHYRFNESYAMSVNYKWMHVSNGQGLGPFNPSYEGKGFGISLVSYLR